ncbi:MAG: aspartate 1-decarboxylase [Mariniblastus sp.]|nr:aspartate 1-decarboxylase [Mariniblastus sp.]
MLRTLLRSKIHRARVTQADLNYEGSITIDSLLLDAAQIIPFEKVDIYNVTNGNRLSTYVIPGKRGSGKICINGAAARMVDPEDVVIICCYGEFQPEEIESHSAMIVLVDDENNITRQVEKSAQNIRPS